jgi:hypothetical protein
MDPNDIVDAKGERLYFSQEAMRHNHKTIDNVRTLLTLVGGCCAGILGCTGFNGAILYVVMYVTIQLCILAAMGFDTHKYTAKPMHSFLIEGVADYGLSYILFWTLFYALVYIY